MYLFWVSFNWFFFLQLLLFCYFAFLVILDRIWWILFCWVLHIFTRLCIFLSYFWDVVVTGKHFLLGLNFYIFKGGATVVFSLELVIPRYRGKTLLSIAPKLWAFPAGRNRHHFRACMSTKYCFLEFFQIVIFQSSGDFLNVCVGKYCAE